MKLFVMKKRMTQNAEYKPTIGGAIEKLGVVCINASLKNIFSVKTNKKLSIAPQCSSWAYSYMGFLTGPLSKSSFRHLFLITTVCLWNEAK